MDPAVRAEGIIALEVGTPGDPCLQPYDSLEHVSTPTTAVAACASTMSAHTPLGTSGNNIFATPDDLPTLYDFPDFNDTPPLTPVTSQHVVPQHHVAPQQNHHAQPMHASAYCYPPPQPPRTTPAALRSHIRVLKRRGRRLLRELNAVAGQLAATERELWVNSTGAVSL